MIPKNAKVIASQHFVKQMRAKGISKAQLMEALYRPYKITDVRRYPGQKRYCGNDVNGLPGIAVVVKKETNTFVLITLYLDGVVTPIRPDQLNDPHALASNRLR